MSDFAFAFNEWQNFGVWILLRKSIPLFFGFLSFLEEESMMEQIKEEPLEIPDDEEETEQQLDQDIYKGEEDELLSVQQPQQQQETPAEMESTTQEEREEEIIFSVAGKKSSRILKYKRIRTL